MAATVGLGIHMARPWGDNYAYQDLAGYATLAGLLLWAISPLTALAWGAGAFRHPRIVRGVFGVGSAGIGVLGSLAYLDAALLHPDAQGGLAFLFVPLVQWGAVLCLGAACALLRRMAG